MADGCQAITPRSFYNPYIYSSSSTNNKSSSSSSRSSFAGTSGRWRDKRQTAAVSKHTYLTELDEFKFVAPKCLDCNVDGTAGPKGTHVGTLRRSPIAYCDGEALEFLDFEKCEGKLWPVRTRVWGGKWHGSDDFDPRFSRFHVYDMVECVETTSGAQGRDSARFLQLVNPVGTVVTMLGMTECGKRVAVHVYGERPYFYMRKADVDAACGSRCPRDLIDRMVACLRESTVDGGTGGRAYYASAECFDVDVVVKTDIYYYGTESVEFYRVKARSARHVAALCDNFCPGVTKYEGNVDVVTRLVLDHDKFVSFGWYKLTNGPAGEKVQVRRPEHHATSCDVEINCTADNLICEHECQEWPGYKLASFDIECKAGGETETAFPVAENVEDVVIQISCLLYSLRDKKLERVMIFSLGSCDLPESCAAETSSATSDGSPPVVFEFDSEFELLLAFMTFVKQYAPEFVTGYNIVNFDWAFLHGKLVDVYGLRLDGYGALNRGGTFRVWDAGTNRFQKKSKAKINGVVTLDMYAVAVEKMRLRSYKLDAVSEAVLGERKKDLPYKEIPGRFASGPAGRGSIGEYCIQDSVLVGKLFFKFLPHLEMSAVAKLAGILLSRAIYDGQQVRVFTCILRLAGTKGFILPDNRRRFGDDDKTRDADSPTSRLSSLRSDKTRQDFPGSADDDDSGYGAPDDIDGDEAEESLLADWGVAEDGSASSKPWSLPTESDGRRPPLPPHPHPPPSSSSTSVPSGSGGGGSRTVGYQGAAVLDPVTGFHVDPVVVFDFASLYPSIIQAHNLCFTTLAPSADRLTDLRRDEDYFEVRVFDKPVYFVRRHVRESLLSVLLDDWLAMRKAIRAKMAQTEDEEQATLLDKQQAAIKVVCNSVYGFCGVSNGFLPCLDVAATVTTIGRQMLLKVRDYIHAEWSTFETLARAFPSIAAASSSSSPPSSLSPDGGGDGSLSPSSLPPTHPPPPGYSCEVVYGDTDSVFIKFRGVPVGALVAAGQEMARSISDTLFVAPIKLECEKTFEKLLLITKKKYIGVIHGGKMIMKGVELVRRNNCRFINDYARRLIDLVFRNEGVAEAAAEVASSPAERWTAAPLPPGMKPFGDVLVEAYDRVARPTADLDVADFVMSAELSRPADAYVNRHIAHLTVYYKMRMRAEQEPAVKERISYVIAEPSEDLARDAEAVARLRGDPVVVDGSRQQTAGKKRKLLISDMAEDPRYVVEKKARLSTDYYFSHLIGSLTVTFKALFGNDTKITEQVLKRFIPDTHFEPREELERLQKAGFRIVTIGAEGRGGEGNGCGKGERKWTRGGGEKEGEDEGSSERGTASGGVGSRRLLSSSTSTTRRRKVSAAEENLRTLRRALNTLTAARRLC